MDMHMIWRGRLGKNIDQKKRHILKWYTFIHLYIHTINKCKANLQWVLWEIGDWTNGRGEDIEHHLMSLTVDCGLLCLVREWRVLLFSSCPLSSFSILDSPLQASLNPTGALGTASWAISSTTLSHGWLLTTRFVPWNRQEEHITPEGKHGNISSSGAQVTTLARDR